MSMLRNRVQWSAASFAPPRNLRREASHFGWLIGTVLGFGWVVAHLLSCETNVIMATWSCPQRSDSGLTGVAGAAGTSGRPGTAGSGTAPASIDAWSTGFEDGFCDYSGEAGNCWPPLSQKQIVTEPVRAGSYAAKFTVNSDDRDPQSRCIRAGVFPPAAYYSAWYFIPTIPNQVGVWNLFHYQGGRDASDANERLWDVSLLKKGNGELQLEFYNFDRGALNDQSNAPAIPVGRWFHIELYVKRAADPTGEVRLYQDGDLIFGQTGLATDSTQFGQWFVGNFAEHLDPVESTVYVDDIRVASTR